MTDYRNRIEPEELIARVLSGNGTDDDAVAVDRWRSQSEVNEKAYQRYKSVWELAGKGNLSYPKIDLDKEFDHFTKRALSKGFARPGGRVFPLMAKIASAAVLLTLIGLSALMVVRQNEYTTLKATGVVAQYTLPDGSGVSLYPGSKIKYKSDFGDNMRKVSMTGEVFFEVKRDSLKPFITDAGDLSVEVLGTAFNIRNTRTEKDIRVVVEEGVVAVFDPEEKSNQQVLMAGEMIVKERGKSSIIISRNSDPNINAWKSKRLIFIESPIEDVCAALSKAYNVKIMCESSDPSLILTTTFDGSDLDYVLSTIVATLDLKVEYAKNNLIILK